MYEFNPMASMELLQNMRPNRAARRGDGLIDDPERHVQPTQTVTLADLVRRVFQRISSRRRAA